MSEEIEKFIKKNYDNVRRAYEFDNIARKKVVEDYKTTFSDHNEQATPTWETVSAHIRMEWENLKEMLDPMNATRNALLPIVAIRGEMLAKPQSTENAHYKQDVSEAMEILDELEYRPSDESKINSLAEAGAYIVAAIEKLQKGN